MPISDASQSPVQKKMRPAMPYKRKYEHQHSFFFGTQQYHHHVNNDSSLSDIMQNIKKYGLRRYFHDYFVVKHKGALKVCFIMGLPIFSLAIVVMFFIAILCSFLTGIFLMLRDTFQDFGCVAGTVLAPAAILIGGIGGAFFPYLFRSQIIEIHYKFWIQFAQFYFGEICQCCQ